MKAVSQVLGEYAAYHRHPLNRMTHYFGIPLIVFALLLILSASPFTIGTFRVSAADILVLTVIIWYLLLDLRLGLLTALLLLLLLLLAVHATSSLSSTQVNIIFAVTFTGGWVLQLLGHRIEKRRPALVDNFLQIFSAPLFLVSELLFVFGYSRDLSSRIEDIAQAKAREMNNKTGDK